MTDLNERLKGFRTVLLMAPVVLLSILDQVGAINLEPILLGLGLTPAQASAAPGLVALAAIVLRAMTSSPMGRRE